MKFNARFILFVLALVTVTTACKFFLGPELAWSGFSPVIAIALFAGLMIRDKSLSFILPLLALFLSDVAIHVLHKSGAFDYAGLYAGQWKNYLLLTAIAFVGFLFRRSGVAGMFAGGLVGPTLYFLVSNFMVWMATTEAVYAKSFAGLMTCYEAGLPFYRNSLIATIVFLPLIVLGYNYLVRGKAALKMA